MKRTTISFTCLAGMASVCAAQNFSLTLVPSVQTINLVPAPSGVSILALCSLNLFRRRR